MSLKLDPASEPKVQQRCKRGRYLIKAYKCGGSGVERRDWGVEGVWLPATGVPTLLLAQEERSLPVFDAPFEIFLFFFFWFDVDLPVDSPCFFFSSGEDSFLCIIK